MVAGLDLNQRPLRYEKTRVAPKNLVRNVWESLLDS
jgi:hypothetical protein